MLQCERLGAQRCTLFFRTQISHSSDSARARVHLYFHHTIYRAIALVCYTRSPRSHPTRPPPELQHVSAWGPGHTRSVRVLLHANVSARIKKIKQTYPLSLSIVSSHRHPQNNPNMKTPRRSRHNALAQTATRALLGSIYTPADLVTTAPATNQDAHSSSNLGNSSSRSSKVGSAFAQLFVTDALPPGEAEGGARCRQGAGQGAGHGASRGGRENCRHSRERQLKRRWGLVHTNRRPWCVISSARIRGGGLHSSTFSST